NETEIVSGRQILDKLGVWLNHGDGTFGAPVPAKTIANLGTVRESDLQPNLPYPDVVGDFNGDGKPDLPVSGTNSVAILLGNGEGPCRAPIPYHAPAGLLVAADFDGRRYANGQPILDLAVGSAANGDITVLLGNGDGTFQSPVKNAFGIPPGFTSLVVG